VAQPILYLELMALSIYEEGDPTQGRRAAVYGKVLHRLLYKSYRAINVVLTVIFVYAFSILFKMH
jgi:hypothetical protein